MAEQTNAHAQTSLHTAKWVSANVIRHCGVILMLNRRSMLAREKTSSPDAETFAADLASFEATVHGATFSHLLRQNSRRSCCGSSIDHAWPMKWCLNATAARSSTWGQTENQTVSLLTSPTDVVWNLIARPAPSPSSVTGWFELWMKQHVCRRQISPIELSFVTYLRAHENPPAEACNSLGYYWDTTSTSIFFHWYVS